MKILTKMRLRLLFMLLTALSYAQVGINTSTPDKSSVLELYSEDKALLLTRLDDENSITIPADGMIYYDKDLNCFRGRANGVWVDFSSCSLPSNVILTAGQIRFIASVNDDDYHPYKKPNGPATVGALNAGGANETLIDVQGVLTTTGISVSIPYENTNSINTTIGAFSQTVSVPANLQEGGTANIDVELSYPQTVLPKNSKGVLMATIRAVTKDLNVVKLDVNNGIGDDNLGVLLAEFTIATDGNSGIGPIQLRAIAGIPDRNFADADHQFLYVPVIGEDGKTWLNNNLGAHYADVARPNFSPGQQATAHDDYLAYGSLYQWGRLTDGHELVKWTGPKQGIFSRTTSTRSITDIPGHSDFIENPNPPGDWRVRKNDDLWQGGSGTNNPCPEEYRLPTREEQRQLVIDASITDRDDAASSILAFTTPGFRKSGNKGESSDVGVNGFYSSSTTASNIAYFRIFGKDKTSFSTSSRGNAQSVRCIQN